MIKETSPRLVPCPSKTNVLKHAPSCICQMRDIYHQVLWPMTLRPPEYMVAIRSQPNVRKYPRV